MTGVHQVQVMFADVNIQGSPFLPEVYDACQVKVGQMPQGVLGQPMKFDGKHHRPNNNCVTNYFIHLLI